MANANGSIDEIIGQQAYKQVDDLKLKLAELEQSFINTAKAASSLMSANVGGGGTSSGGIKATTQSLSELEKATQKLIQANKNYGSDLTKIKELLAQQNQANRTQAKDALAAAGSYNKMQSEMTALLARYKALSAEMRSGSIGKNMAADIAKLNTELKALDSSLGNNQRNVGNYAGALSKVWSGIRQIAYILPGLGIAGIFDLAFNAITPLIQKMSIFNNELRTFKNTLIEGQKESTQEVTELDRLYKKTQDTTRSITERKAAVDKLQELYPAYFKNIKDENILNGTSVSIYNELRDSIIEVAKVKSVEAKITEIINNGLDEELKLKEKLKKAKALEFLNKGKIISDTGIRDERGTVTDAYTLSAAQSDARRKQVVNAAQEELDVFTMAQKEKLKIYEDYLKNIKAVVLRQSSGNSGAADNPSKTRIDLLQQQYEQELLAAKRQSADLEENESQAFFRRLKIVEKYSNDKLLSSKDLNAKEKEQATKFEEQLLNIVIDGTAKRKEENKKYLQMDVEDFKLNLKIKEEENKKAEDKKKEQQKHILDLLKKETDLYKKEGEDRFKNLTEQQKKELEARKKLEQDIADAISSISDSIINAIYDRKLRQFDAIDKKITSTYENELRFIEQSGLSAKQKERQKQELEAETEAKRKKNDKERVDALRKQAKLQKALDINSLIASTAIAVMSALGAKPYTPANIALAAGAAVTGAAQLAKVIATPLPQYAKGRKGGKAEWAIVGEEGTEGIRTPDGKMTLTPNKPTVTFLPKDAEVIPHHEMIKNAAFVHLAKQSQVTVDKYQQALIDKFEEELEELRGIKSAILNKEFGNSMNVYKGFEQYKNTNIR
jgi:hypothetical protein